VVNVSEGDVVGRGVRTGLNRKEVGAHKSQRGGMKPRSVTVATVVTVIVIVVVVPLQPVSVTL
jgi:hypothetical protein